MSLSQTNLKYISRYVLEKLISLLSTKPREKHNSEVLHNRGYNICKHIFLGTVNSSMIHLF